MNWTASCPYILCPLGILESAVRYNEFSTASLMSITTLPDLLHFMPALNVSDAEIDQMIALLDGLLQS